MRARRDWQTFTAVNISQLYFTCALIKVTQISKAAWVKGGFMKYLQKRRRNSDLRFYSEGQSKYSGLKEKGEAVWN